MYVRWKWVEGVSGCYLPGGVLGRGVGGFGVRVGVGVEGCRVVGCVARPVSCLTV